LGECQKEFLSITDQNFNQDNDTYQNNNPDGTETSSKKFDSKGFLYANIHLDSDNIKIGSIIPQQEFRFMFLRDWTLYNSVYYSNYVMSKLKLWNDLGKRELNKFFAMMGIPANEYNQQYRFMTPKYKDILKTKIMDVAPKFDLKHILMSSFVRQIDNKTQLNASDMVYAITSLLESSRSVMVDDVPEMKDEKENVAGENEEVVFDLEKHREMLIENFWAAYKALNIKNKAYIDYGMSLSKEMQIALMKQGTSLITNKEIKPCTSFRYTILSNDSLPETKIFQHPLAIQKLAIFVMEAYRETRESKEDRPMIVAVKNTLRNSFLVSGVLGKDAMFTRSKNEFGTHFQEAAEKIGATFKYDGFEASIIEIGSDHFEEFIDELIQL
jgi:cell division control protein 45